MSQLGVAPSGETALSASSPLSPAIVAAVATAGGFIAATLTWQSLMQELVFPNSVIVDAKTDLAFRQRLQTERAKSLLMLVWKDSDYVSAEELEAAGAHRVGTAQAPINCHNLAKRMALGVDDFDKMEKAIQQIVKAAEAYGLILREACPGKARPLRGTALLHSVMLAFDGEVRPICADILATGPGAI
jgi:hypothetical protein